MSGILRIAFVTALFLANLAAAAPVHDAVKAGDIPALKKILATGPQGIADAKDKGASTPLHWASTWNKPEAASVLIRAGANVEARTDNGAAPLHWAAYRNALEVADLLIRFGADISATSEKGYTPLHWAAIGDAPEVARLLLTHNVDVNAASAKGGVTPLHCAIRKKNRKILPLLIESGADLYQEAADGSKPISWITDSDYRAYVDKVVVAISQKSVPPKTTDTHVAQAPTTTTHPPKAAPTPRTGTDKMPRLVLPDGSRYEGSVSDDLMHGKGVMMFVDGSRYTGAWREGLKQGFGVYEYANGEKYSGYWVQGQRAGQGTYTYLNSGTLKGQWSGNKLLKGSGLYFFPDGDRYEGEWRNDMMWGLGTYTTSDGQVFHGSWHANEFIAPPLSDARSAP